MQVMKKSKQSMQGPDFSVSKVNREKAEKLFDNFYNGTLREIKRDKKSFSSIAMIKRMISKTGEDPSDKCAVEVVTRLQRDKVNSQIALQIAEICQNKAQNLQKTTLIKMIPFFAGIIGVSVLAVLAFTVRPLSLENPDLIKYLIPQVLFLPLLVWGFVRRGEAKFDMITANIVMQGSSAYASAKMQGKSRVGAMQNLQEMKRKAKALEQKQNEKKDKKTKNKK